MHDLGWFPTVLASAPESQGATYCTVQHSSRLTSCSEFHCFPRQAEPDLREYPSSSSLQGASTHTKSGPLFTASMAAASISRAAVCSEASTVTQPLRDLSPLLVPCHGNRPTQKSTIRQRPKHPRFQLPPGSIQARSILTDITHPTPDAYPQTLASFQRREW